ncbi:MAG: hypothetical protein AB1898_07620 [Acidobacteriota bacterium]
MPMSYVETQADEVREGLKQLIGLRLVKCWNAFATRYFYFSDNFSDKATDECCYTLDIECAWRITKDAAILVGLDDYSLPADDHSDPDWRVDMPTGHLQDQKLRELLGEIRGGEIINTGSDFIAQSVEVDEYGGFRINLAGGYTLEVFPASSNEMMWSLIRPGGGALGWTNGKGYKTEKWLKAELGGKESIPDEVS